MKKISKLLVSLFLVATFVISLAACKDGGSKFDGTAKDLVNKLLLTDINKGSFDADFEVPATVTVDGYTADVTWTSKDEAHLKFEKKDDSLYTGKVTRPAIGEEDAVVEFTASVTHNEETATKNFKIKVIAEKDPMQAFKDFHQNPVKGQNITVEGYISFRGSLRNYGDGYGTYLWIEDVADYGGYYAYNVSFKDVADYDKWVPGTHVEVSGKVDVYNGSQIKSPKVTVLEGTKEATVEDITGILPDLAMDENLEKLQTSNLVKASGLKVVEKKAFDEGEFNPQTLLVVERAGKTINLIVDKYAYSDAYEKNEWNEAGKAMAAKAAAINVGDYVTVKGLYGFYGTDAQINMLDISKDAAAPELTDKEKAVAALTPALELVSTSPYTKNTTIELLADTDTAKYTYTLSDSDNSNIKLEGRNLVITVPQTGKVTNELTIKATVGQGSAEQKVTITTEYLSAWQLFMQGNKGDKITGVSGVVTSFNWYKNTATILVQNDEGGFYIYCKGLEDSAKAQWEAKFKIGYEVSGIEGEIDNYGGLQELVKVDLSKVVLGDEKGLPTPKELTEAIITDEDALRNLMSTYVTVTVAVEERLVDDKYLNYFAKFGNKEIEFRVDNGYLSAGQTKPKLENGKTYKFTGFVGSKNGNLMIMPVIAEEVAA